MFDTVLVTDVCSYRCCTNNDVGEQHAASRNCGRGQVLHIRQPTEQVVRLFVYCSMMKLTMNIRSPICDCRATVDDIKYPPEYKIDAGYFSVTKATKVQQIQEFVVHNVVPTYMDSLSTCKVAWDNNEKDHCFRLEGKSC